MFKYKWDPARIEMYYKAIEKSDYPNVFIKKIMPFLQPSFTVLDIGTGPGAFALSLAPHVKHLYALEKDALAMRHLFEIKQNRGLHNINCIFGPWPSKAPRSVDVIISAFTGTFVLASKFSLKEMAKAATGMVFLIAPAQHLKTPFQSRELYRQKGYTIKRHTSIYTDTTPILDNLGIDYKLELVEYDFGQPVANEVEAEIFLSYQLPFSRQTIRDHVKNIITQKNDQLWLPNPLKSAFIYFDSHDY